MHILVTGHQGYIGAVLAPTLVQTGYTVTGLDTGLYTDDAFVPLSPFAPQHTLTKDTRHVTPDDLAGIDAIVHLAELSNDPLSELNPALTEAVNVSGTTHLATIAKAAGIPHFIYASSCSVYGKAEGELNETSPTQPLTTYAHCKVAAENHLLGMTDETFHPILLRNATVFGLSPRMRFDVVVNNLTGLAYTSNTIAMNSDGSPWRPLIHVQDLSNAVLACVQQIESGTSQPLHGQIINLGNPRLTVQIKTIATTIGELYPQANITFGPPSGDNRSYQVSFAKLQRLLPEYTPQWDLRRGITQLLGAYQQINLTEARFTGRPFTRLKQLQHLIETQQVDSHSLFWTTKSAAVV